MRTSRSEPAYYKGLAVAGMLVLLVGGYVHRRVRAHIDAGTTEVASSLNLTSFPKTVYGWDGNDLEIPATTVSYMRQNFADDYFSRRYMNNAKSLWADVYVVYCTTRPASIIGHKPQVCYKNSGWIPDSVGLKSFTSRSGRVVPCLIHRFHRPRGSYAEVVILNFYVVNGRVLTDEGQFTGLIGRRPNIGGKEAKYVAQIQISAVYESNVLEAARDMVDTLFNWLPDEEGHVQATQTSENPD
ncbi:MAG: exosortase-associated EpsI family protein [Planctomycetes bacterium]|nr:exosortase-associated EpsI family protein [Planctomycetota bacterium]